MVGPRRTGRMMMKWRTCKSPTLRHTLRHTLDFHRTHRCKKPERGTPPDKVFGPFFSNLRTSYPRATRTTRALPLSPRAPRPRGRKLGRWQPAWTRTRECDYVRPTLEMTAQCTGIVTGPHPPPCDALFQQRPRKHALCISMLVYDILLYAHILCSSPQALFAPARTHLDHDDPPAAPIAAQSRTILRRPRYPPAGPSPPRLPRPTSVDCCPGPWS